MINIPSQNLGRFFGYHSEHQLLAHDAHATHTHSAVYAMAHHMSVCLSITSRCTIATDKIQLLSGTEATICMHILQCVVREFGRLSPNKGTSVWNLVYQTPNLV